MRLLLVLAAALQVAAVIYCTLLLRRHRNAPRAWLCLLGALLSMLVWRLVMTTGITPNLAFNTVIAIWGSVSAVLAMFFFGREAMRRERAEAERDRLLASERAARAEAEQASRIKDDFLATLSHELRSPLAAMLGWCAIGRRVSESPEVTRALDTIERNARMQARLVDDLLDATRMQSGSLHLETQPVPLDAPLLAALDAVRPAADAKQVTFRVRLASPAPVVVGDPNRLQQIASNLLVNAVKFTPEGRSVEVRLEAIAGQAQLTVSDEGIGIAPDFMPQLFQRFRQAETGDARRHGGLGLGLSIVSSLVHLHQGEVHASSDGPGTGATFVVRLPLASAASRSDPSGALDGATPRLALLSGVRVLLVDDEADVRGAVAGLLESAGATVRALDSGRHAEGAIDEFRPALLLLDIGMPGEDGYTLLRRLRADPSRPGRCVPAVSLTAHARDEDRQRALEAGFSAHLTKPVNLPLMLATIRRVIDEAAAADLAAVPGRAVGA